MTPRIRVHNGEVALECRDLDTQKLRWVKVATLLRRYSFDASETDAELQRLRDERAMLDAVANDVAQLLVSRLSGAR